MRSGSVPAMEPKEGLWVCKALSQEILKEFLYRLRSQPIQNWSEVILRNITAYHIKSRTPNVNIFADDWPEFKVIVYTDFSTGKADEGRVLVYCRDDAAQSSAGPVQLILQTVKAQCPTGSIFMGVDHWLAERMEADFQCSSRQVGKGGHSLSAFYRSGRFYTFYLPDISLPPKDGAQTCPGEYVMKKLEEKHIDIVAASWPYVKDMDHKNKKFLNLIKHYHSVGLFPKQESGDFSESPIGWCLQYAERGLAHLFVDENYRKKGLAKVLVRHMCDCIIKDGEIPTAVVGEDNVASLSLFKSLGFVQIDSTVSFVKYSY